MTKSNGKSTVVCANMPSRTGTVYPEQFAERCSLREKKVLGDVFGLTQFGVNLTTLPPGQWSALRHWHKNEDEFVYVVSGSLVLVDDDGEHPLTARMCAGFAAGVKNGHHIVNKSDEPGSFIEVGTRVPPEHVEYPDDDLIGDEDENGFRFSNRAGEPYS